MSRLGEALEGVVSSLAELGARGALIGGIAVSARAEPRFTRDVDLAVAAAGDDEAESLVHALAGRGYAAVTGYDRQASRRRAESSSTCCSHHRGSRRRSSPMPRSSRSSTVSRFRWRAPANLVALKLLARDDDRRPQDAVDLRALVPLLDEVEERRARTAVRAIIARGFARGRDLETALDELLRRRWASPTITTLFAPP